MHRKADLLWQGDLFGRLGGEEFAIVPTQSQLRSTLEEAQSGVDAAKNRPPIVLHQPAPHRRWLPSRDLAVGLFLLGATGNARRRILRFALERGHKMTALVGDQKQPRWEHCI